MHAQPHAGSHAMTAGQSLPAGAAGGPTLLTGTLRQAIMPIHGFGHVAGFSESPSKVHGLWPDFVKRNPWKVA